MSVVTEAGEVIGEVLDVMENPAHDLLVTERGLIPMRREFIKEVDKQKRQIVVTLPKGLLSEEVPRKHRPRWQR
jgi:ribosomal 30S subunit maturation factor RimM